MASEEAAESTSIAAGYEQAPSSMMYFRPVDPSDLDRVHQLESASYPEDEAATYEKLKFRIEHASNVFMVAVTTSGSGHEEVCGFICGTCTPAPRLTHDSMARHEPEGALLCVHSVCVDPARRRQRIASRMLLAYLGMVQGLAPGVTQVRLICKQDLVGLYSQAGFALMGPSDVVHGKDPWLEMVHSFQQDPESAAQ